MRERKKNLLYFSILHAKSCELIIKKEYWVHLKNKSKKSRISCLYVFSRIIVFSLSIAWLAFSLLILEAAIQNWIAAVYLDVGIYYIKAHCEMRNKEQRRKSKEGEKKNKCLLFINSYKTSIYALWRIRTELFSVSHSNETGASDVCNCEFSTPSSSSSSSSSFSFSFFVHQRKRCKYCVSWIFLCKCLLNEPRPTTT